MPHISQIGVLTESLAGGALCRRLFAVLIRVMAGASPSLAEVTSLDLTDTTTDAGLPRESGGQSAELLFAFFGLDNALSPLSRLICRGAPGKDGMPVIFSTEIDHTTMQAGDFRVTTASGALGQMQCVTLLQATDGGELRTVLLVGEFGTAETDPPVSVEIVGHLHSIDGMLNFRGASIDVTPPWHPAQPLSWPKSRIQLPQTSVLASAEPTATTAHPKVSRKRCGLSGRAESCWRTAMSRATRNVISTA
ncbi:MAG: hypothetical protein AAFR19_07825 [Pseudomonadota bacterium]